MLKAPHRPSRQLNPDTFRAHDAGFEIKSEYGLLRLDCMLCGILRVRFTRKTAFSEDLSPFIAIRETETADNIAIDEDGCLIDTSVIKARVSLNDGGIGIINANGDTILRIGNMALEEYTARKIESGAGAVTEEVKTADGVKLIVRDAPKSDYKQLYRATLPLELSRDEAIYGFGQPEFAPANLRGRRLYLVQTNKSIAAPFFVSTAGYGVLIDCGCPIIFDDTGSTSLRLLGVTELDFYVIPGSCEQVVSGYHFLTGNPSMLPAWAFGYIQSQERYETQDEIVNMVKSYRDRHIGIDCAVMDWSSWPDGEWGQKSLDKSRFYDPYKMINDLHDLNTRFMISIWPNPHRSTSDSKQLKEKNLLLPGGIYDALNKHARDMYWNQTNEGLFKYGVDAWWCDSSEPWTSEWSHKERPDDAETFFETANTASDAIGMDKANAYAFYHALAMYEGQRGSDGTKRVVNLTRSAWTGQQRLGTIMWSGDISASWDTLKTQIAIGLNMSASGFPYWTQDIGGFFVKQGEAWYWNGRFENGWNDPEFRELFIRWYQYAAFLPIFRGHGTDIRRELTNLEGAEFDAVMKYNRLRYRLLPYIYSLAALTALRGGTIIKPLGFNYPDDETARNISDEYLFGNDILVCPVYEYGVVSRKVYLPQGTWHEIATGRALTGGWHEAHAPKNTLPLFVKSGAIIPYVDDCECSDEAFKQQLKYTVFAGADGKIELYSDALDGYGFEQGEYEISELAWVDKAKSLTDSHDKQIKYVLFGKETQNAFQTELG